GRAASRARTGGLSFIFTWNGFSTREPLMTSMSAGACWEPPGAHSVTRARRSLPRLMASRLYDWACMISDTWPARDSRLQAAYRWAQRVTWSRVANTSAVWALTVRVVPSATAAAAGAASFGRRRADFADRPLIGLLRPARR